MKIRLNYVSNSSSSSYIIGIGIIKDEYLDQINKFIKESCCGYFEILKGENKTVTV
jgi:hypothetical protein